MADDDRTKIIPRGTPESAAMLTSVRRAMAFTAKLNHLTFNDADEVRVLFSELIGKKVDDSFLLIPPFYTTGGVDITVGRNVFVNQNCTFYDLGGGGRHQGRFAEYACWRESRESHSIDWRLTARAHSRGDEPQSSALIQ